jgi:hypothetical protein
LPKSTSSSGASLGMIFKFPKVARKFFHLYNNNGEKKYIGEAE